MPDSTATVFIAESRERAGQQLEQAVRDLGHRIFRVTRAREGMQALTTLEPDILLVSLFLDDEPGVAAIERLSEHAPGVPVIAVGESASTGEIVAAIRRGASHFLAVPSGLPRLQHILSDALTEARHSSELARVREEVKDLYGFRHLLTQSPRMLDVFDQVRKVATTDATVLIRGETGTGKELISRAIHDRSRRKDKPFISVNCGAFTESLLESELFGHEKGSFTGAVGRREGLFEMADGGTLFLDELGETTLNVQVNLLRVLEEMTFRRVGGRDPVRVDVRIVAATNVELESAVAEKRFREDLYYRLAVFPITLPPLRSRREDVPLLMRHFLDEIAGEYGLVPPVVSADAMDVILGYHWPGNVRQLRALCERWVITRAGLRLEREHLAADMSRARPTPIGRGGFVVDNTTSLKANTDRAVAEVERTYLFRLLENNQGRLVDAAEHAGITRRTLYTKIKQYGLSS